MKTYIVKKITQDSGCSSIEPIFITNDKEYAEKYVKKFNRILSIARNHQNDMAHKKLAGLLNINKYDSMPDWHYYPFYVNGCEYQEIETRPQFV